MSGEKAHMQKSRLLPGGGCRKLGGGIYRFKILDAKPIYGRHALMPEGSSLPGFLQKLLSKIKVR